VFVDVYKNPKQQRKQTRLVAVSFLLNLMFTSAVQYCATFLYNAVTVMTNALWTTKNCA